MRQPAQAGSRGSDRLQNEIQVVWWDALNLHSFGFLAFSRVQDVFWWDAEVGRALLGSLCL